MAYLNRKKMFLWCGLVGLSASLLACKSSDDGGTCNLATGGGCKNNQSCYLSSMDAGAQKVSCLDVGAGTHGNTCTYVNDCAKGLFCQTLSSGTGVCRKYCDFDDSSSCGSGYGCNIGLGSTAEDSEDFGYCSRVDCSPLSANTCDADEACYVNSSKTACLPIGAKAAGATCAAAYECQSGFDCSAAAGTNDFRCHAYCDVNANTCVTGETCVSLQLGTPANLGVCLPM